MPGTDQEVQNDTATADPVAPEKDIDLDRAAAEAEQRLEGITPVEVPPVEPKAEETPQEPVVESKEEPAATETPVEPQEDPDEHKERTKLGRKVAKLEDTIGKLLEQNAVLIEKLTTPQPQQVQPVPQEVEQEYVDLSTPEGLRQFMAQERERERLAVYNDKAQYNIGYVSQVKEWTAKATEAEDADALEINKLLTGETPFNVRHSSDPKADFVLNLSRAEAHYYKQKAKTPAPEKKAPLMNDKPRAPLSVGGESKSDAGNANAKPLKLSPAALEFAKSQGWSDEEVQKTLSTPIQNSFMRGRR